MNKKFAKIIGVILCLSLLLTLAVGCDSDEEPTPSEESTETEADTTTEAPVVGLEKTAWEAKFSDEVFKNYTVIFEGTMTVTQDGVVDSTSLVWQKIKTTAEKVELTLRASEVASPTNSDEVTMSFEGETAEIQKIQNSQLFLTILRKYENFKYNAEANTYTIPEDIVLNEVLKASHRDGTLFDVPAQIEIREAVVTFSEDGMIATFSCDYSQAMDIGDSIVTTSGKTTWTFTDFGTTVIE